jgi:glycosyltransferase involved in cell wall biosynthesis
MKKILFLTPYPFDKAGSQRFRFEMFFDLLEKSNFSFNQSSFIDEKTWSILYKKGYILKKILGTVKGYLRRFLILFQLYKYDFVFVHREASPLGPPIFEFLISKVFRKKMIFDFDDSIWKMDVANENKIASILKQPSKIAKICKWSYKVSAGNDYLADYARQYNSNTFVIPTIVDTEGYHNRIQNQETENVNIGWTGSNTTIKYLDVIVPPLKSLEEKYDFTFYVIADKDPHLDLKSYQFIPWKKETEIDDLLKFHIGLMPLHFDEWEKGKCGFKAIQYMALGIPAIIAEIGVNKKIINHEKNGFLISNDEEWESYIKTLLCEVKARKEMGLSARKTIEDNYSKRANFKNFINLFS